MLNQAIYNSELLYRNFKSLSKSQRRDFINILLNDKEFEEDLLDIAVIEQRKDEPAISLEEYLLNRKNRVNDL